MFVACVVLRVGLLVFVVCCIFVFVSSVVWLPALGLVLLIGLLLFFGWALMDFVYLVLFWWLGVWICG